MRRGTRTYALIGTVTAVLVAGSAEPALAAPGPSPAPANRAAPANAPILDISAPVLDITERTASLDGSVTDVNGKGRRTFIVAADVVFAFDKAALNGAARVRLAEVAAKLRTAARAKTVSVDGYTDAKGSAAYNLRLSQRRAQAVAAALRTRLGGTGTTFAARGHGSAKPVAANTKKDGSDNPSGRAKNRRVEISFTP
ncbi:MAG TPA: OmpA family protein [Streptosporangiaceae bacterium]|jgi:outer membrane protein OmpA-like peptidoglycan-associated protein